jgi:putative nucleotidyltransferase with HDIG domain
MTIDPDRLVADVATLVSLPEVVVRINTLVDDPRSSAEDIGRAVAQDAALTARLLTLANSAMFGMQRKIDTVGRAVAVLGTRQVRDLTLGLSAVRAFSGIPNDLVSMGSFWHHSVLCAVAARSLAGECAHGRPESSFVAGLLHDIGQLVLFNQLPNESRRALLMSVDAPNEPDLYLCEREVLGFDHAAVGSALARRWRLPPGLVECIAFHHDPASAQSHPLDVAIVHIANSTAVLAEVHSDEFEDAPAIDPVAFEVTGLRRAQLPAVAATASAAVEEVTVLLQMPDPH